MSDTLLRCNKHSLPSAVHEDKPILAMYLDLQSCLEAKPCNLNVIPFIELHGNIIGGPLKPLRDKRHGIRIFSGSEMSLFQGRFKNQKRKKLKHEFIQASYFQGIEKQFEYGFENQLPTFVLHLIHLLGENQILDHCFAIWNTQAFCLHVDSPAAMGFTL
uniref:Uncharacterized protein n=1 Tax=Lactuca sativa TaxID=4236 RepID=A0A9R1X102_LACSA|nr:hypothetical protein LSAT_V11C700351320 [Lactuca sativa]